MTVLDNVRKNFHTLVFGYGRSRQLKDRSPLGILNTGAAGGIVGGAKLAANVLPTLAKYPALTAAAVGGLALFTPQGRAISSNLLGGAAYKGSQDVVGLFGGGRKDGNKSVDTQTDPGGVRGETKAKPRKARKAATHTSRRSPKSRKPKSRKPKSRSNVRSKVRKAGRN